MMNPVLLAWLLCGGAITACSGAVSLESQQQTPPRNTRLVSITGEFRADGSCEVSADGKPVFAPSDSARSSYVHAATLNFTPSGLDAHQLWCAPHGVDQTTLSPKLDQRLFVISLYAPGGDSIPARRYEVRPAFPRTATDRIAGTALFGTNPQLAEDPTAIPIGISYLLGIRGTIDIARADAQAVAAKFSFMAYPARSF